MSKDIEPKPALGSVYVAPARLRLCYWLIVCGLCGYGAWVWMGSSGTGLFLLWLMVREPWRTREFLLSPEAIDSRGGLVTPWQISFVSGDRRLEVFKDEVSAAHWAGLRRALR